MNQHWSGKHHCVGALVHSADKFADALRHRCEANGGSLSARDIDDELSTYKSSPHVHHQSSIVFDQCSVANSVDRARIFESEEYAAFAIFRAFHDNIGLTFSSQISRCPLRWRIEFSKAMVVCAQTVLNIKIASSARSAYRRASVLKGSALCLEDVLSEPEVTVGIKSLQVALAKGAVLPELQCQVCKVVNDELSKSLNIVQPHTLLVSEPQMTRFMETVEAPELNALTA